jgi:phosphohistidine swiveling domain-containing protein
MRPRAAFAAVTGSVVLAGCVVGGADPAQRPAALTAPPELTTVLAGSTDAELSLNASRALYRRAPTVVTADAVELRRAAPVAVRLGLPLLAVPREGTSTRTAAAVPAELRRLKTVTVLAFGDPAGRWLVNATPDAELIRERLTPVGSPDPLGDLLVLVPGGMDTTATTATARAAGARVLPVDRLDPRADRTVIRALSREPAGRVLALGSGFGPPDQLRRRLEVAATGVELPAGGQVLFPGRHMVALYGHPGTAALGVLGEQSAAGAVTRARRLAEGYRKVAKEPVVPAFEIITTVASATPGRDGDYSSEASAEMLRPWIEAAGRAGVYVVLDLQPGRADFLTQARRYAELLAEPHVGLALDPEWRLGPRQRHMVQIGSVRAAEVNSVVDWLADFTRERKLPQKLLMVHQFRRSMIGDRGRIDTGRDEVAVLIHADGFGTPGQKFDTWRSLRTDPPRRVWWGWKNFYDEDRPTFTPRRTMSITPRPVFVSYQ